MDWLGKTNRYKLIFAGTVILLVFTDLLIEDLRAYRGAGSQPIEITAAQVREITASPGFVARWVRVNEPLDFQCSQSLGWEENGKVLLVVLAFDQSKQQPFWLEYKGQHSCDQVKFLPLDGLLVQPDKFWIKQGMVRPTATYPLLELKVGASPADLRKNIYTWVGVDALGIVVLIVAVIARPRKSTSHAQRAQAENPWSVGSPKR